MNTKSGWPGVNNHLLLVLHVGLWVLIFVLSSLAFVRMLPFQESLVRAFFNTALMMALFYGVGYVYQRYYEQRAYTAFGLSMVAVFVVVMLVRYIINQRFSYEMDNTPYYNPGPVSNFFGALITNMLTMLNSLVYQLVRSRVRLKHRQAELLSEQQEAKLQFLRAQMNPHFLFNTLNNIYSLAVVKSDKTAPLVLRLSELLQYVIYDAQKAKTPLAKEISVVEEYIDLFQLQYEEPKRVDFDYELPRQTILLEPLLLIPLVENCFKHADFQENAAAFVRLKLAVQNNTLRFWAENSYNPQQQQKDKTGGVGLQNIQRRLQLQYPDRHRLQIIRDDGVFKVELQLELSTKSVNHA